MATGSRASHCAGDRVNETLRSPHHTTWDRAMRRGRTALRVGIPQPPLDWQISEFDHPSLFPPEASIRLNSRQSMLSLPSHTLTWTV